MTGIMDARAALRERLGPGARYDDPRAPSEELRWARLGTAYFARKLNELTDKQLSAQTDTGLRLRRVVCEVSYQARSLAQIIEWSRNGIVTPKEDPFEAAAENVRRGLTLPAAALRHLFKHSEVHLNVEWRDLRGDEWDAVLYLHGHKATRIRETAWNRARSIWLKATDLGSGGSFTDFPPDFIDALLTDISGRWNRSEAFTLQASDRKTPLMFGSAPPGRIVRGRAADLARWVTGHGAHKIDADMPLPEIDADQALQS